MLYPSPTVHLIRLIVPLTLIPTLPSTVNLLRPPASALPCFCPALPCFWPALLLPCPAVLLPCFCPALPWLLSGLTSIPTPGLTPTLTLTLTLKNVPTLALTLQNPPNLDPNPYPRPSTVLAVPSLDPPQYPAPLPRGQPRGAPTHQSGQHRCPTRPGGVCDHRSSRYAADLNPDNPTHH